MIRAILLTASMLALLSQPATAEVEVEPSPIEAQVKIKGIKVHWNFGAPKGDSGRAGRIGRVLAKPPPIRACKIDDVTGVYGCRTYRPADPGEPDAAELTEGDILRAVREIGLPSLTVRIEPGDSTLVNARTNFFTDPVAFAQSVSLIGFDVDLEANPIRYAWIHGDGTSAWTTKPGRPYPHLDVTHRYREPAGAISPRVDVTYRVRYRVDGGAWATLGQTLTAPGPAGDLAVNEAAPVLTAP